MPWKPNWTGALSAGFGSLADILRWQMQRQAMEELEQLRRDEMFKLEEMRQSQGMAELERKYQLESDLQKAAMESAPEYPKTGAGLQYIEHMTRMGYPVDPSLLEATGIRPKPEPETGLAALEPKDKVKAYLDIVKAGGDPNAAAAAVGLPGLGTITFTPKPGGGSGGGTAGKPLTFDQQKKLEDFLMGTEKQEAYLGPQTREWLNAYTSGHPGALESLYQSAADSVAAKGLWGGVGPGLEAMAFYPYAQAYQQSFEGEKEPGWAKEIDRIKNEGDALAYEKSPWYGFSGFGDTEYFRAQADSKLSAIDKMWRYIDEKYPQQQIPKKQFEAWLAKEMDWGLDDLARWQMRGEVPPMPDQNPEPAKPKEEKKPGIEGLSGTAQQTIKNLQSRWKFAR